MKKMHTTHELKLKIKGKKPQTKFTTPNASNIILYYL